ncbi:hypothetical protein RI129_011128 [Pyrocoelia pectoralis]|uniref:Luciferin 4-monooxygenase-like n=1 Tax=Pyrocoelia pectoralis TaxID=417401 RepID=A0AAN7V3F7_9COLE
MNRYVRECSIKILPSRRTFSIPYGPYGTKLDLLKRCIRTAKALQAHDIQPQDAVVLHSHNHINTVVPVIASYFIGAIPSCIDFNLTLEDTVEFLKQIQSRIIFTHSLGVPKLKEAVRQLGNDIEIVDFEYFNEFIFEFTPDNFQPTIIKDLDKPATEHFNHKIFQIVHPKTGDILGPGKIGELYFKSVFQPSKLSNGYEWDESGFFKTGDLGYYDDAFCFYITDRIKEVFYYKMISIFPSKLEAILKNHPAVKDAVIIGVPHDFDTNHPMALVIRHDEMQKDDGEQLRGGLKFVDRIPSTATGKTNRAQAKRLVLLNQI